MKRIITVILIISLIPVSFTLAEEKGIGSNNEIDSIPQNSTKEDKKKLSIYGFYNFPKYTTNLENPLGLGFYYSIYDKYDIGIDISMTNYSSEDTETYRNVFDGYMSSICLNLRLTKPTPKNITPFISVGFGVKMPYGKMSSTPLLYIKYGITPTYERLTTANDITTHYKIDFGLISKNNDKDVPISIKVYLEIYDYYYFEYFLPPGEILWYNAVAYAICVGLEWKIK